MVTAFHGLSDAVSRSQRRSAIEFLKEELYMTDYDIAEIEKGTSTFNLYAVFEGRIDPDSIRNIEIIDVGFLKEEEKGTIIFFSNGVEKIINCSVKSIGRCKGLYKSKGSARPSDAP